MAAIFGEGKIFWKLQRVHSLDTLWVENFDEIALSRTVKEIEANLCYTIFGKNSKIQNGRHFRGGEIFFENSDWTTLSIGGKKLVSLGTTKFGVLDGKASTHVWWNPQLKSIGNTVSAHIYKIKVFRP